MTCSGRIVPTGADGSFVIADLSNGGYALKAVFPGMADALLARLAVTSDVPVTCRLQMTPSDAAVVSGHVTDAMTGKSLAAWFEARSGSKPVRWFDAAGRPYGGRSDVPPEVWHQPNRRFWTSGTFAFSADPGKLHLTVRADGYAPATVERVLQAGRQETLAVALKPLFDPAAAGWYKGDFHAQALWRAARRREHSYDRLRSAPSTTAGLSSGVRQRRCSNDAASIAQARAVPIFCSF